MYDIKYIINNKGSEYFPVNITFYNKEPLSVAFQILLRILNGKSLYEKPRFHNWVIVHKLEYISNFSPFSIYWKHRMVNMFINIFFKV